MTINLYQGGHNNGYIDLGWLRKKANSKISDRKTSKEKFRRRINGRQVMKSNKDQRVAQKCGDGKNNVQR